MQKNNSTTSCFCRLWARKRFNGCKTAPIFFCYEFHTCAIRMREKRRSEKKETNIYTHTADNTKYNTNTYTIHVYKNTYRTITRTPKPHIKYTTKKKISVMPLSILNAFFILVYFFLYLFRYRYSSHTYAVILHAALCRLVYTSF